MRCEVPKTEMRKVTDVFIGPIVKGYDSLPYEEKIQADIIIIIDEKSGF